MANFYARYNGGIFGGGGGSSTFTQEQPTGAVNGVNVTYTITNTPSANANVILWLDGIVQYQGIGLDYTIASKTITMAVAPVTNQTLWAFYS